ncbi:hypothetical protein F4775DRAFT_73131 [Biscogniauxia sp. FL1348]|nr:hypothetical protein F4775DRAFT_73131 [Biscogniauxia sp. FL1348]
MHSHFLSFQFFFSPILYLVHTYRCWFSVFSLSTGLPKLTLSSPSRKAATHLQKKNHIHFHIPQILHEHFNFVCRPLLHIILYFILLLSRSLAVRANLITKFRFFFFPSFFPPILTHGGSQGKLERVHMYLSERVSVHVCAPMVPYLPRLSLYLWYICTSNTSPYDKV